MISTRRSYLNITLTPWICGCLLLPLLLNGCGQKGDLYMPPPEPIQTTPATENAEKQDDKEDEKQQKTPTDTELDSQ